MKISYKWLKEFVQTDHCVEKISDILTQTGLEVEGIEKIEHIKGGLEGVYIGEVMSCEKHPDADRLKVTQVDIGKEKLQIVCGASNIKIGQKVTVATVGCTLYPTPDEAFKIKKTKIRGIESFGMICAEDELGLGKSHDGIMVLDSKISSGLKAADYFKLESDYQIEIGLTPNRADAMSHLGVARDLKAFLNFHEDLNLSINNCKEIDIKCTESKLNIDIIVEDTQSCPSYLGTTIADINVKESPDWLKNKLTAIGLNPINNIVDVTNYVMHELGTPLHAFDADFLNGKIVVKNATEGNKFQTLDGNSHKLKKNHLMITNGSENLCIAGVFGGQSSGITNNTKNIFLECAYFDPTSIRKTAKDLGLNTDASFRFERGIDPSNLMTSITRATNLIQELAGGSIAMPVTTVGNERKSHKDVIFSPSKARKLIGNEIGDDSMKKILSELEIKIESIKNKQWSLSVPSYRVDVNRQADIVEEILRIYGFNNVNLPDKLNSSIASSIKPDIEKIKFNLSSFLVSRGYYEVINNSLTKTKYIDFIGEEEKFVKILNPLSKDLAIMRRSMVFGLLENMQYNINRQQNDIKFFEYGKTYHKQDGFIENHKLCIGACGKTNAQQWNKQTEACNYFTIKGIVEAVFNKLGLLKFIQYKTITDNNYQNSVEIFIQKTSVGILGNISKDILNHFDVKQDVFIAELNWDGIEEKLKLNSVKYQELPKTFSVKRDLSLLLDKNIEFSQIQSIASKCEKKYLKKIMLFDVYEGDKIEKDKKSYSVSFILQNDKETMKEKQIEGIMQKIQSTLIKELGASLR